MEDKSELCARWEENGGCALDRDFVISELDPWNGNIPNREFFDFMQMSCPASCGWADQRGCVDEHPRCEEWTRAGICNTHPFFMAHTCRESCGVCGFLSPFNNEDQVVAGASYSDFKRDDFKCGKYKLLCEINGEDCEGKRFRAPKPDDCDNDKVEEDQNDVVDDQEYFAGEDFDLRSGDSAAFSFKIEDADQYYCGATIISDRWNNN